MSSLRNVLLLLVVLVNLHLDDGKKLLSRRKRFLMFPEGSSFSVALCNTVQMILPGQGIFTEAVNWGINYNLPHNISEFKEFQEYLVRKSHKHALRRRRRDLYGKVETIMTSMGYDGRSCILRALCETTKSIVPNGDNIVKELFRIIFTFPLGSLSDDEPEEHRLYHRAGRLGTENQECAELFSSCPISLLDLAMGMYSVPASIVANKIM